MTPRERYAKQNARKYKDKKTGKVKTRKPSTSKERRKMNLTGRSLDQVRAQRAKRDARAKRKARRASTAPKRSSSSSSSSTRRTTSSGSFGRWTARYKK